MGACSSGDDDAATTSAPASVTAAGSMAPGETAPDQTAEQPSDATTSGEVTAQDTAGVPVATPVATPAPPPTGVPGLDSDDDFCSAWSRFGGSWQVLVQANFAGDPQQAARLEVIASTLVGDAYDDVFEVWPSDLDDEREVVADGYFGPFRRRSTDALQALVDSGASDDDIARLADVWSQSLAGYDPAAAAIDVEVPADLESLVSDATELFVQQRVALPEDPTMVITVSTPETDAFLGTACPDQGWIVGQDVVDSA